MLKKILLLSIEYRHTTVVSGSRSEFFVVFWLTKFISVLAHHGGLSEKFVHTLVAYLPKRSFVIKNQSGTFRIQAYDDSLTICSKYFESELRPWLASPTTHELFIDIGANRGLYSILACTQYGYTHAYAFEPNQDLIPVLEENRVLNHLSEKMTIYETALGDREAEAAFTVDPLHKGGGRLEATTRSIDTASTVPVTTLDRTLTEAEKSRVSFVKIDTEGYEFTVLGGMPETLARMPQGSALMIETHDIEALISVLSPFGFTHRNTKNQDHLFIKV